MPSAPPCLLAFDTATETVHVGLAARGQVWARAVAGGAQASSTLLPAVQSLFDEAALAMSDLDAVAFGRGPGAFTGLRTACAVAQGLALGLEVPVIALDTLLVVAQHARLQGAGDVVWAMSDARMNQIYAAAYAQTADGAWHTRVAPALFEPAALVARLQDDPAAALAGNALHAHAAALAGLPHPRFAQALPCGEALAALAVQAWRRGDTVDPALALPLYVRDKVAQTTAEREAAKAQAAASVESP